MVVALEYRLKGNQTTTREFFTNSREAHDAKNAIELRYGNEIQWCQVASGDTVNEEYEKKYGIKKQQKLDAARQKQIDAQEKRLQELENKSANIDYKQSAEKLKTECSKIVPDIDTWKTYKSDIEDEINSVVDEVRKKLDEYSELTSNLQNALDSINSKIDEHNNQPNIYDSNKIKTIKDLDNELNTKVDFSEKKDEDLGVGGWIFIILFLAGIFYPIDWFFDLNIYSGSYTFIKDLLGQIINAS